MNKQRIIKVLEEESKNWWTKNNIENIDQNHLIPEYIHDETDYYLRLHEETMLMYEGNMDALELLKNESRHLKMKNKLLMPIYS